MSPPLHLIPLADLEQHATSPQPESPFSTNPSHRTRKNNNAQQSSQPPRALSDCALKELTQYKCNAEKPKQRGKLPLVICEPVVRLFRECANGMHVETTAWEEWKAGQLQRQGLVEGKKV